MREAGKNFNGNTKRELPLKIYTYSYFLVSVVLFYGFEKKPKPLQWARKKYTRIAKKKERKMCITNG